MPLQFGLFDLEGTALGGIVVVACVGRDMIKVWPLPVEQPWREDAIEMPDGELACCAQGDSRQNAQTCAIEMALSVV